MIQIDTSNCVRLDGVSTKLCVTQDANGTRVYDRAGKVYTMPSTRYSLTTDQTNPGVAGVSQFDSDIRALLA